MPDMMFCRGCGKEIHSTAPLCPHCGAPQGAVTSPATVGTLNAQATVPDGVRGWSWGAFLLSGFWSIGNRTWIGLLAFIPYLGIIMAIILGIKGREWAWKNRQWQSLEEFNRVQRRWSVAGLVLTGIVMVIAIIAAIAGN